MMSENHLIFKREIVSDLSQNNFGGILGVEASVQRMEK